MNYYERYMGDYQRDTGQLSLAEHGAYSVLLDTYYSTEQPLPSDTDRLFRLCRAMTKAEQAAVVAVADQFFPVCDDGLRHNARADREIEKARPKMEAARANGKRGGRPRKNPEETQQKPSGFSDQNPAGTQGEPSAKAPQPQHQVVTTTEANASVVASHPAADRLACPHQEILALWAEILPELPNPKTWGPDRERALRSRWNETAKRLRWETREQGVEWFGRMFRYIRTIPFLMGETARGEGHEAWTCDLPFILTPKQFAKIIDGGYRAKEAA